MLKQASYLKIPSDPVAVAARDFITTTTRRLMEARYRGREEIMRRGLKIVKSTLRFGYNGDDFMNNMVTVVFDQYCSKVPRILNPIHKLHRRRLVRKQRPRVKT